ncbi:putative ankyrin repeat protein RF_0381 [Cloeon dipterum]|uniref:putative ankyrin repeat protein RF_0381 n=1 Tax=Cloeon dipterum TaxID=197152 RepID=UPI0032208940
MGMVGMIRDYCCDENSANAIHHAASVKFGSTMIYSIQPGPRSCDRPDAKGKISLEHALGAKNIKAAKLLFNHINTSALNVRSLLDFCVRSNNLEWAEFVLQFDREQLVSSNTLLLAARYADGKMFKWLFRNTVDDGSLGSQWKNFILHFAASNKEHGQDVIPLLSRYKFHVNNLVAKKTPLTIALADQNIRAAEQLIKIGANLKFRIEGYNLLQICTINSLTDSMTFLYELNKRVLVKQSSVNGESILMAAAMFGTKEMCEWLHDKMGEKKEAICNKFNATVTHYAAFNKKRGIEIIDFLGRDVVLKQVHHKNQFGETPLHCALKSGNVEVASHLIKEYNADLSVKTRKLNLLHFCVMHNQLDSAKLVHKQNGKLILIRGPGGKNALHVAAERADLELCLWLVEQGVNPKHTTCQGETVLNLARKNEDVWTYFNDLS